METVLPVVLSIAAGAVLAWMLFNSARKREAKATVVLENERLAKLEELQSRIRTLQEDSVIAAKEAQDARLEAERARAAVSVAEEKSKMLERTISDMKEAKREEAEQLRKEYDEKLQKMTLVFNESASRILKEKSADLSAVNSKEIGELMKPMQSKMDEFRKAVEESRDKSMQTTASLEKQISMMMDQAMSIGKEANNLASALRSNNKALGNWGEVVLLNLLEGMGLRAGEDFVVQQALRDADGATVRNEDGQRKSLIPDVVVFLPGNKAVVVDSKVSLTAYVDYVNAPDDSIRAEALKNHLRSVESHIRELAAKNYSASVARSGKDALDYVVMFVPNEGAFQLFYQNFRKVWHEAFDRRIIIAGESNLFAMLKIIENSWIKVRQEKNIEEVMKVAGELLDRVARFATKFYEAGMMLDKARDRFDDAGKVLNGRQSLVVTSRKLEKMGVPFSEKFPSSIAAAAEEHLIE